MAFICLEAAEVEDGSWSSLSVSEPESVPSGLIDPGVSSPSFIGFDTGELTKDSPSPFSEPEPWRTSGEEMPGTDSESVETDFPTFCCEDADPEICVFGNSSNFWMFESINERKEKYAQTMNHFTQS